MQMDRERPWYAVDDNAAAGAGPPGRDLLGTYGLSLDIAARAAAEVEELVAELEPRLNARERRLLHQLRLAAESLGTIRASASLMSTRLDPVRSSPRSDL